MLASGKIAFPPGEQMLLFLAFFRRVCAIEVCRSSRLHTLDCRMPSGRAIGPRIDSCWQSVMLEDGYVRVLTLSARRFRTSEARACAPWINVLAIASISIYGELGGSDGSAEHENSGGVLLLPSANWVS